MKKNLLTLLLIASSFFYSFAQITGGGVCSIDPNATGLIYPMQPDSVIDQVGDYYEQTITLSVPTDTTVSVITVYIDSIVLLSVDGLPTGLTYGCNSSLGNCTYVGGSEGCFIISGTVNDTVGIYPITFNVELTGVLDSTGTDTTQLTVPYALEVYSLYVGNVGVEMLNTSKFDVIQNVPNPFNGSTTIKFNSPVAETVNFSVYDMIGRQVHTTKIDAVTGVNTINYTSEKLAPGAYFYTLANGKNSITKRMVLTGK